METQLTTEEKNAFDILVMVTSGQKDIKSLNQREQELLFSHYTPDVIRCFKPLDIPVNKTCCRVSKPKVLDPQLPQPQIIY